jgi:hypothetical protein
VSDSPPPDDSSVPPANRAATSSSLSPERFAALTPRDEYTDERKLWEWQTKYAPEARRGINWEAWLLGIVFVSFLVLSGLSLSVVNQSLQLPLPWLNAEGGQPLTLNIEFRLIAIFFVGCIGGATFSIKWLMHAVATGRWHLDRRYWRVFVPLTGGVYACVVLTLFDAGLIMGQGDKVRPIAASAALAFLVGYFSDGVSGLLSNIANAVFGTLEKK